MKKYNIFGTEVVKVSELRHAIRRLRRSIPAAYHNFDEDKQAMIHLAYNDVVKQLYREELREANSPEEIKAILEMPGDFIVCNRIAKRDILFFSEFEDGEPIITRRANRCMHFDYESKANEIAERLNDNIPAKTKWLVVDMSKEEHEANKRLLKALFGDDEEES